MIADMFINKKLNPIITELCIRGRKLNISLVFIMQFYFAVPKDIIRNCTHYFIIKIQINENLNKLLTKIHQILTFKTLLIFTKYVLQNHILFYVIDNTLTSDNPSTFRKNLKERI